MKFLGPYSDAETALEATRVAIADLIKAGDEWPAHGNAPLAIAALVASQVNDIAALKLRSENAERDLRHWREEVGKLHSRKFAAKEREAVIDALNRILAGEWQHGDLPIKFYESALAKL